MDITLFQNRSALSSNEPKITKNKDNTVDFILDKIPAFRVTKFNFDEIIQTKLQNPRKFYLLALIIMLVNLLILL